MIVRRHLSTDGRKVQMNKLQHLLRREFHLLTERQLAGDTRPLLQIIFISYFQYKSTLVSISSS